MCAQCGWAAAKLSGSVKVSVVISSGRANVIITWEGEPAVFISIKLHLSDILILSTFTQDVAVKGLLFRRYEPDVLSDPKLLLPVVVNKKTVAAV